MSIAFDYKPWKVKLQVTPKKPIASLVSLYDLIATEDGELRVNILNGYSGAQGVALSHDLIYYNAKFWSSTGNIEASNELEDWELLGIDIGPVTYDSRAKHKTISIPTESKEFFDSNANQRYILHNKDAALYPSTAEELYKTTVHGWEDGTVVTSYSEANPFTVGTSATAGDADILLTDPDSTFNATLVNATGISGYTGLLINIANSVRARTFISSLTGLTANALTGTDFLKDSTVVTCLKNTYVWVRTAFFGDYINPDSFNQELTSESDVIHKNIMISSDGDFNRYDGITKANQDTTKKSENTRPYIPQTVPSVDLLSNRIVSDYTNPESTALSDILEEGAFDTEVGSLKTEPISREDSNAHILYPPAYLDPETPKSAADFGTERPVLVPKDGNATVDGRLVSPTIDELWHYIKRLVSGRINDYVAPGADKGRIEQTDPACMNDKDTCLNQPTEYTLPVDYQKGVVTLKKGDPLETLIKSVDESGSSDAIALTVSLFVNAPQSFSYSIFEQIRSAASLSEKFSDFFDVNNYVPYHQDNGEISYDSTVHEGDPSYLGDWAPRANPYSLRELELAIMEIKYNLLFAFRQVNTNFAEVGSLAKHGVSTTKDENDLDVEVPGSEYAGSLYMLHKDYNKERDLPNTWFNPNGSPTGDTRLGASVVYSDVDENGAKTFTASNYGSGANIPESQENQTSAYTFLAADGTWRTMEHVRIPILDEEY